MGSVTRRARLLAVPLAVACGLWAAPAASADLPGLLAACGPRDALDDNLANGVELPFAFCDDGVPDFGGTTMNPFGQKAVRVPASYAGATGLPPAQGTVPGADPTGRIAIDADVSVPDPERHPVPPSGYPLVVLMHGCCGGDKTGWEGRTIDPGGRENWHYNNAWFASRGYVVLNYTARGFVNSNGRGSTGQTQLDSNRFEINDYQHLAGQLADVADLNPRTPAAERVDPQRIVPTGGSYGGGFTWLALTDPVWRSPGGRPMRVVVAAPKFGWTNLVEALVPNGDDRRDRLPTADPSEAGRPIGFPKRTIVSALYASGKTGVPPGGPHTTFAPDIDQALLCLSSVDPYASNPLCAATLSTTLPRFLNERSAYFQNGFFNGLATGAIDPVPVFSAGAFTDQLFPAAEHRRMVERLKLIRPGYPVQEYYGDYNHFVQDKRKEWADLCGADRHVCTYSDYDPDGPTGPRPADLNAPPANLVRDPGVTTRLNRFLDHYAKPSANPFEPQPSRDVTGSLQVCPQNAGDLATPADEPGPRFTAPTFDELAPNRLTIEATGAQATTNVAAPNPHARNSDPVANLAANGGRCPVEDSPGRLASAGPGVATYDSSALPSAFTMLRMTRVVARHTGSGAEGLQLNARLYDLHPDGTQVLVDRGVKRLTDPNGSTTLDLHGTGWRFEPGHRIRVELAQDDDPYVKSSVVASSLVLQGVQLSIPVREASTGLGGAAVRPGGSAPRIDVRSPRLASDRSRTRRFPITIRTRPGTARSSIAGYRLQIRDARGRGARISATRTGPRRFFFRGRPGHTYRIRARAVDGFGRAGPWDAAQTIVPYEDGRRATPGLRYRGRWKRARVRNSYGRRLSRSDRRGATLGFRFRGTRLFVIGRTSRRGGKALVVVNGRVSVISFYGRRTRNRRVVGLFRTSGGRVNRAAIVTLGRKGSRRGLGRRVEIDALGVRRP